jgi:predicted ATP-grasp superfamily ATP-dependent carboligase
MRIFLYEYTTASLPSGTSCQSLQAEGWAMLSALLEDFNRVPGVETVTLLETGSSRQAAGSVYRVSQDHEKTFCELAHGASFTLVIAPEFDDILLTRCRWVEEAGGRLLGSSPAAVVLAADKLALGQHLREFLIPTPECRQIQDGETPADAGYPLVWKPRYGAGSLATFLVNDSDDWRRRQHELKDWAGEMFVQPFVAGLPASVAFLVGKEQQVALQPTAQILSQDGRFRYLGGSVPLSPQLAERAVRLAARAIDRLPGLHGYVGVDVVLGEAASGDQDYVIEINPRLTTSYVGLRALAESNLAAAMLQAVRGERISVPRWKKAHVAFEARGEVVVESREY